MFISASLLVTFITLTASFLRALSWVRNVADCSDQDSECLYRVQRWLYKHIVESFVGLDPDAFELQASGVCQAALASEEAPETLRSTLGVNIITAEVLTTAAVAVVLLDYCGVE